MHTLYKSHSSKTKLTEIISKSHHTENIRKNYVHKLLFANVQILEI